MPAPTADASPALVFEVAAEWARKGPRPATEGRDLTAIRQLAARVVDLPPRQILHHLDDALMSEWPDRHLRALSDLGVLAVVLPEVALLRGFHHTSGAHHKDLWQHTLQVTCNMVADLDLRWAALMHDVGKVATRAVDAAGRVSFWYHEPVGAFLMRGVGARLRMPAERVDRIAFIIGNHARVNAYQPAWSDRAVRRLMRIGGDRLDTLLEFSARDVTTKRADRRRSIDARIAELRQRIARIRHEDAAPRLPTGLGHAVRDALDLTGAQIGAAMAWLKARVAAGELPPGAAAEVYLEALRARDEQ